MDETIKINALDKNQWSEIVEGFHLDTLEQIWQVYGMDGRVAGTICELVDGKYYLNGQPDFDYASLQAAAGALLKRRL